MVQLFAQIWLVRVFDRAPGSGGADYPSYFSEAKKVALLHHDPAALAIVNAGEKGFAAGGVRAMWERMLTVQKEFYLQGALRAYPLAQTYSQMGENKKLSSICARLMTNAMRGSCSCQATAHSMGCATITPFAIYLHDSANPT